MLAQDWEERCKNASTDQEKLDVIVEHLTEWHLDIFGGYPHGGVWVETVEGKIELLDWFERARQLYKQWHEKEPNAAVDFSDALLEVARQ